MVFYLEVIDKFLLADYDEDNDLNSEINENEDDGKITNKKEKQ